MPVWNPSQYLAFKQERTQPSLDLISRIHLEKPGKILDLGCGPGNSTAALRARWPKAHVAGLDNSPEMIEAARKDFPGGEWLLGPVVTARYGGGLMWIATVAIVPVIVVGEGDHLALPLFRSAIRFGTRSLRRWPLRWVFWRRYRRRWRLRPAEQVSDRQPDDQADHGQRIDLHGLPG